MSTITEFANVHCPFDRVRDAIRMAFRAYTDREGNVRIPMRVALGELKIARDVIATLHTASDAASEYDMFRLGLRPADGGPFPPFDGTLSATYESAGWCRISISGEYAPPLGLAGMAFDAAVGNRLATKSIADFLALLKRDLEAAALLATEYGD
jgi:hypothetical protein